MEKIYDFKKWVDDSVCPCCGANNYLGTYTDMTDTSVFRDYVCDKCGAEWNETYKLFAVEAEKGNKSFEIIDTDSKIAKATLFAKEQVESLSCLLLETPLEEFEGFFKANHHLTKEIGYDLGMIQGYMEALDIAGVSLGEKLDSIIDLMQENFDRA